MKSPIVLLSSLLIDFKRLNPGVNGLDRDLITIERRVRYEGEGFLTIALPALDDALVRGLASGKFACPTGFKKIRGGSIPRFLSGMICKIFDAQTGTLIEPVDYGILRDVHTFLRLCKKTQLQSSNEDILHKKAVDEFYRCDDVARSVSISDRHRYLIDRVSRMILLTLHKKDYENENIYRHGPGAVCESYSANQKWDALYSELRDNVHLPDFFGYTNFRNLQAGFDNFRFQPERLTGEHPVVGYGGSVLSGDSQTQTVRGNVRRSGKIVRKQSPCLRLPVSSRGRDSELCHRGDSARLISVLKNSTSRRTITIEPFLRQFLQQGLNTLLRESISECKILGNCLALTDQSKNQKLALEGSLTGRWSTIDLKSASDLLSLELVESVFRHHPMFLDGLLSTRSPKVTSPELNSERPLWKFAGMGNATTFPVQSVCFAVVCIAAICDQDGRFPSYGQVRRASRKIRIYGDDIIVDSSYAHLVVQWLSDVGLQVNVKKSFLEGDFRESCGVEAFRGVDITPLYLRHWPHNIGESPSVCAHLVSLSNHMWLQGLYEASNCLKDHVEEYLGNALPLVSSRSGSLGWHTRLDAVTPHKWCRNTHQFLTRTFALKPVKCRDRLDGYGALLKCLITPLLGRSKDHLERTAKRFANRLVRRWVPSLSYEGLNLQL